VLDAGEPGLTGWTLFVDLDTDGTPDPDEPQATTDADGRYQLTGLDAGPAELVAQTQEGWQPTGATVIQLDVTSGFNPTHNFGFVVRATIRVRTFDDRNGDGIKDDGEGALVDKLVYLDLNNDGSLNVGEPSGFTDGGGEFTFRDLAPGTYQLRALGASSDEVVTTPNPQTIVIDGANRTPIADVGLYLPGRLSGILFHDLDANNLLDQGDLGLANWSLLIDFNGNRIFDPGEVMTATGTDGRYSFTRLGPGPADVVVLSQQGFVPSEADFFRFTVTSGSVLTHDFGFFRPAEISGTNFEDENRNGARDSGERGLFGWTIYLDDNDNGARDAGERGTTTDFGGGWTLLDLRPGTYRVRAVAQIGWEQTTANPAPTTLVSGQSVENVDFGNAQRAAELRTIVVEPKAATLASGDRQQFSAFSCVLEADVVRLGLTGDRLTPADFDGDESSSARPATTPASSPTTTATARPMSPSTATGPRRARSRPGSTAGA
jgi:hypothetical protein